MLYDRVDDLKELTKWKMKKIFCLARTNRTIHARQPNSWLICEYQPIAEPSPCCIIRSKPRAPPRSLWRCGYYLTDELFRANTMFGFRKNRVATLNRAIFKRFIFEVCMAAMIIFKLQQVNGHKWFPVVAAASTKTEF